MAFNEDAGDSRLRHPQSDDLQPNLPKIETKHILFLLALWILKPTRAGAQPTTHNVAP